MTTTKAKDKAPATTGRAGKLRVSSDPSDPGYKTWTDTFGSACQVIFNGVDLGETAIMADEELGEIIVHMVDPQGNYVVENDMFVPVTLHGKVEIRKVDA